jgi:hypothetical protein
MRYLDRSREITFALLQLHATRRVREHVVIQIV